VLIPWPDLPLAMNQGVVNALITTHESTFTAKLWDAGMTSCFEDRQLFAQYIPMVSRRYWDNLSTDLQRAMAESWQAIVDVERREAAEAQDRARGVLIQHGVKITTPDPAAVTQARRKLMAAQDEIVAAMNIDRDLVGIAVEELRAGGVQF
jgi:TRAP-type transport system periplasmic protein